MSRTATARKPGKDAVPQDVVDQAISEFTEDEPKTLSLALPAYIPPDIATRPHLPWSAIRPSPLNPRTYFDDEAIASLAESIAMKGINQNLMVRPDAEPLADGTFPDARHEIVMGESRWRAVRLLIQQGRADASYPVPVVIRAMNDADLVDEAMTENVQRQDLRPMEEARGLLTMEKFGRSTAEIGRRVSKSQRWVQDRLGLVKNCSDEVQAALESGAILPVYGRTLATAPKKMQMDFLTAVTEGRYESAEELRDDIRSRLIPEAHAVFDLADYDGDWIDGERSGQRYFGDVEQFKKLQFKAARAKAEQLETAGAAWSKVTNAFHEHQFNVKAGHKDAGVVVVIAEDGRCTIHADLVYKAEFKPAPTPKTAPPAGSPTTPIAGTPAAPAQPAFNIRDHFTEAHAAVVTRRRIHAIQEAVYQSPVDAMRIMIFALLSADQAGFLPMRIHDFHDCGTHPAVKTSFQKIVSKLPAAAKAGISTSSGVSLGVISAKAQDARLIALFKLSDKEVMRLFSHTIAARIGYYEDALTDLGDTSEIVALATGLGIAGKEAQHGLAITPDDTTGLGIDALKAVASDLKIPLSERHIDDVEVIGNQVCQSLKMGNGKGYVLPTLRFADPLDVEKACTAFVKRPGAKTPAKSEPAGSTGAKPKAKPAAKKPASKAAKKPTAKKKGGK